jgi:hypothetical protein
MKFISKLAIASAVIALAYVSTANAQSMRVSVPFGFRAAGQSLPAGTYKVELSQQNQRVTLTQLEGNAGCFAPIRAYTAPSATEQAKLVFNRYGNSYFLTRVSAAGSSRAAELFSSRDERELAKAETPLRPVQISASGM